MTEPTHDDTPDGLLSDIIQMLMTILFREPDAPEIAIPRRWLAAWLKDLQHVLAVLRDREPP